MFMCVFVLCFALQMVLDIGGQGTKATLFTHKQQNRRFLSILFHHKLSVDLFRCVKTLNRKKNVWSRSRTCKRREAWDWILKYPFTWINIAIFCGCQSYSCKRIDFLISKKTTNRFGFDFHSSLKTSECNNSSIKALYSCFFLDVINTIYRYFA